MKKKGILDRLKDGPVLGDGGYLLELEKRGWVRAGPFTPEVALPERRDAMPRIKRCVTGRRDDCGRQRREFRHGHFRLTPRASLATRSQEADD